MNTHPLREKIQDLHDYYQVLGYVGLCGNTQILKGHEVTVIFDRFCLDLKQLQADLDKAMQESVG
jgi:hypothetical protein